MAQSTRKYAVFIDVTRKYKSKNEWQSDLKCTNNVPFQKKHRDNEKQEMTEAFMRVVPRAGVEP
ncbi:MAG: hypothetical protein KAS93_02855, partial [Gammaproteobacteria bacterium]|nr:hypothetical protein [Gammaproteobacteria bacterium]